MKGANKAVFFVGGIDLGNMDIVLGEGAENIAVIRAIVQADNVVSAARSIKKKMMAHMKGMR